MGESKDLQSDKVATSDKLAQSQKQEEVVAPAKSPGIPVQSPIQFGGLSEVLFPSGVFASPGASPLQSSGLQVPGTNYSYHSLDMTAPTISQVLNLSVDRLDGTMAKLFLLGQNAQSAEESADS